MKRTNTAVWMEKYNRWQIKVQKDGIRRSFESYTPGRAGQREANARADAWLEEGIEKSMRCGPALDEFVEEIKARTSYSNYDVEERRVRLHIKPYCEGWKVVALNDDKLQSILDHSSNLTRKSQKNVRATLVAFVKFCRRKKWTSYIPDDVIISKTATSKAMQVLQPSDLDILFSVDTTVLFGKIYSIKGDFQITEL